MNSGWQRLLVALAAASVIFFLLMLIIAWLKAPASSVSDYSGIKKVECMFDFPQKAAWRLCTLPHNWDREKPDYTGDAWYRLHIPRPEAESGSLALWMAASMNASVSVNGVFLGSGGRMREPVARNWNRYLLFTIPDSMLNLELNEVVIRVFGYANNSSGLVGLYLGEAPKLVESHTTIMMRSNFLTYGAFIITLLVGALAGIAAIAGRSRITSYFALGCLTSLWYLLDTMLINIPFSRDLWERGAHISIICSEMFFILFIFQMLEFNQRWLVRALGFYGIAGSLIVALVPDQHLIPMASVWEGISLIMLVVSCTASFHLWVRNGERAALIVALALWAIIISFAHDWIPWVLGRGVAPPFTFYLGPVGFVVTMAAVLISRLIIGYQDKSTLSLSLRQKIQRQDEMILRKQAAVMQLWADQAVRDERDRIVRELHDGVGGILSGVLATGGIYAPLRNRLQDALAELRLIMGAIDDGADIASLLGSLRPKLDAEVERSGCVLIWDIDDIPAAIPDNPTAGMHLVRIIQECVHNALRHGHATEIRLHMDQHGMQISDNGCGFDVDQVTSGRGLKNLRWRTGKLGGLINITSASSGTVIGFYWE